ncbi:MAG: hypothetical protein K0U64_02905 [Actinomycetia bacterium]|nr:hypothetical protein [Actinomycetes bacterium]
MTRQIPRQRLRAVLVTATLGTLMLAGCTASDSAEVASLGEGAAQPAASAESAPADGGLAFARCMRDNGVDFPDPDPEGGFGPGQRPDLNFDSSEVRAAMQACESLRPGGGPRDRTFDADAQEAALAVARCMRESGYEFPDPQFDANGNRAGGSPRENDVNMQDAEVREALAACRESLGLEAGGPGGRRGPTAGPEDG